MLCLLAKSRGYGVACKDLEFSRKKAGLREYGAAHARRLSIWAYARFFEVLRARCGRDGVDLAKVDPAFTSVIGRMKYARCRAMGAHHAAALAIGRAAQGHGERLVSMDGSALVSPARMKRRTERKRWRGARRLTREARAEPPGRRSGEPGDTARSEAGLTRRGVPDGPVRRADGTAAATPAG